MVRKVERYLRVGGRGPELRFYQALSLDRKISH